MDTVTSIVFFVVISFVTCEDVCEVERIQNGDVLAEVFIATRNSTGHQTGTKTVYVPANTSSSTGSGSRLHVRCKGPYKFQGDRAQELAEITCTNGKWVPFPVCLIPSCRKRSLNYPGLDKGGERIYFHGESFEPKCQDGYRVAEKTDKRIHCENGQWTGNLSPCIRVIGCERPEDPENGKAIYTSLDYNSELIYECSEDLQLSHNEPRICGPDGQWTGTKPTCREPCAVPAVANGQLGKYEEYHRYRWRSVFKKVPEGTILDENEQVILKCDIDYMPRAASPREITITCQRGKLRPEPECPSTRCNKSTLNYPGLARSEGYVLNGSSFVPTCLSGYEVTEKDDKRVHCNNRTWTGNLPPCTQNECEVKHIPNGKILKEKNNPLRNWFGIVPGKKTVREPAIIGTSESSGAVLYVECDSQHRFQGEQEEESEKQVRITCTSGQWTPLPVCQLLPTCSVESLFDIIPEGVVPLIDENIGENVPFGQVLRLSCDEGGSLLSGANTAMCTAEAKWRIGDNVHCIRGCASLQKKNGSVLLINPNKKFYRMGESVTFSCPNGKELTVDVERILCLRSGWVPDIIPDCQ